MNHYFAIGADLNAKIGKTDTVFVKRGTRNLRFHNLATRIEMVSDNSQNKYSAGQEINLKMMKIC